MDMIYGLPRRNITTFGRHSQLVTSMRPDRIAVYSYTHVPWLRPPEPGSTGPATRSRDLQLPADRRGRSTCSSTPDRADRYGPLRARGRRAGGRGQGATAPSKLHGLHHAAGGGHRRRRAFGHRRSVRRVRAERQEAAPVLRAIDEGRFPRNAGYLLSDDDRVGRSVVTELMCNYFVDRAASGTRFGIDFQESRSPAGCAGG